MPLILEADSATGEMLEPATKPVMLPPSFWAAVTAEREEGERDPLRCSRMARVERRRARRVDWREERGRGEGRRWWMAVWAERENIVNGVRVGCGEML